MSSLFYKDIAELWGVGTARAKLFRKLGVDSIGALIEYYPRSYIDFTNPVKITDSSMQEECCIRAQVISDFSIRKVRSNMTIYKCEVSDGHSKMTVVFFNNRYVPMLISRNKEYFFLGKVSYKNGFREMVAPIFEAVSDEVCLRPVYRQTDGLSSKVIERAIKSAFKLLPEKLNDCFPAWIIEKYKLCDLKYAIKNIHFPSSYESLELARKRISFEKLLVFYMSLLLLKSANRGPNNFKISADHKDEFLNLLDFDLTNAQNKVIDECIKDMSSSEFCMNRLIQGDVGCGKTVVAAALCYSVIKSKRQVAFMAPTEILSKQHYNYFSKLFSSNGIRVALLTSSTKTKDRRLL